MHWISRIAENLAVMILTIVFLLAAFYVVLLLLHWGLKLKTGKGEAEGLADLWQEALPGASSSEDNDQPKQQ